MLQVVTLKLFAGDRETLRKFYPKLGYQIAIRNIVHQFCRKLEEQANREIKNEPINITLTGEP